MTKIILIFLVIALVGIAGFFYFSNQSNLSQREFTLKSKKFSILVPSDFKKEGTSEATVFANPKGQITHVGFTFNETTNTRSPSCKELNQIGAFSVTIASLNTEYTACEFKKGWVEGEKTFSLNIFSQRYLYQVTVSGKKEFLAEGAGKNQLKEILESFSILD